MSSWSLAVDFGTSFTCAAVEADGRAEVLEIDHSRAVPSVVCLTDDDTLVTGRPAASLARVFPERAERLPKRALVAGDRTRLGDRTFDTAALVAVPLARVYAKALERFGGVPPARVVLTHPAAWDGTALDRLRDAAARAGLPAVELVPEPVAAALHYSAASAGSTPVPPDAHLAVYDLGGGTFDTAVLRHAGDGFTVRGTPGGDPHFGGEDVDEALFEVVAGHARALGEEQWESLWAETGARARRAQALLLADLVEAKETLSEQTVATVQVDGLERGVRVTRAELEAAVDDRLRATVDELVATVTNAGVAPGDLHAVYLTGGASRMPRVSELVAERTGRLPRIEGDPKAVVALGALRHREPAVTAEPAPIEPVLIEPAPTAPVAAEPVLPEPVGTGPPTTDIQSPGSRDGRLAGRLGRLPWPARTVGLAAAGAVALLAAVAVPTLANRPETPAPPPPPQVVTVVRDAGAGGSGAGSGSSGGSGGSGGAAVAARTSTTTPTPTPTPAPTPTAGRDGLTSGAERALFDDLRDKGGVDWDSCISYTSGGRFLVAVSAAIKCDAEGLDRPVIFRRYADRDAGTHADWEAYRGDATASGECPGGTGWAGAWSSAGRQKGFMICRSYPDNDGVTRFRMVWGSDSSDIAGVAVDGDASTVYGWWRQHADTVP